MKPIVIAPHRLKPFPSIPLRFALIVPFMLQTVGVVALVGYLSYRSGQQAAENLANQLLKQTAERVSDRLNRYLHTPQQIVAANRLAVEQRTLSIHSTEQLRQRLWQQIALNPSMPANAFWGESGNSMSYYRISSREFQQAAEQVSGQPIELGSILFSQASPNQRQFFATDSQGKPGKLIYQSKDDFRTAPWYRFGKTRQQPHWSPIGVARIVPLLQTLAVAPVYDAGKLQGFFTANYLLPEISLFLNQLQFSPAGQVFIIEGTGDLVATSVPLEASGMRWKNGRPGRLSALESQDERTREVTRQLFQQLGALENLNDPAQIKLAVANQNLFVQVTPYQDSYGLQWYVVTVIPESDFMAEIQHNTRTTVLLCLLALGVAISVGLILAHRLSLRIQRLNQASQSLAQGDLTQQLPSDSTITELQGLAQSFNQMADQLRQMFQKQVEAEATRQTDARFQQLATAAPGMIYTYTQRPDGSHRFEYVSSGSRDIFELDPEQLLNDVNAALQQMHPEDRPSYDEAVARSAATLTPFNLGFRNLMPSGQLKYLEARSRPMRQEDGSISWYGILQDVSARKQVEAELHRSEARNRMILNSAIAAITSTRVFPDRSWMIDQVSAGCESLSGYTAEELTQDQNLWLSRIEPQDWQPLFPQTIADIMAERTGTYEYRFHHKDGSLRWISQTNNSRWDEAQHCWVVTMFSVDITARKQAELALQDLNQSLEQIVAERTADLRTSEAQLQQELMERQQAQLQLTERNQQLALANQELTQATRLKDEFLANMSHELRTPLNAILGMAESLQEEIFGSVNPQQVRALQTIEHSGSHLLDLINDILDMATIDAGRITLNRTSINVISLCQSCLDLIQPQASQKQIRCQTHYPAELPELYIDERRIRQALTNLLENAVKFTPAGGTITLEINWPIEPSPEDPCYWLQIAVRDTGIGIAAANLPKLFQSFRQIDSALNRQYEGTGLGLALTKRIVELHNGRVGVTSQVGAGSCFTIDFPTEVQRAAQSSPHLQPDINSESPLSNPAGAPCILLVEDNEANSVTIASYLEITGNRLLLARDGAEALAILATEQPDVILMDIQMPGMDGLEAIQRIRCLPDRAQTPIIALTALAMEGDRARCMAAGANAYLSKPVKLKQLAATIQQLLHPLT